MKGRKMLSMDDLNGTPMPMAAMAAGVWPSLLRSAGKFDWVGT
jgi:hypothetical protein